MIETLRDCEIFTVKTLSVEPFDDKYSTDRIMDTSARIAQGKADYLGKVLAELEAVKMQRLTKKCRHPKKDYDVTSDGQKYCMNCNANL
jgi:hypothetical protein